MKSGLELRDERQVEQKVWPHGRIRGDRVLRSKFSSQMLQESSEYIRVFIKGLCGCG